MPYLPVGYHKHDGFYLRAFGGPSGSTFWSTDSAGVRTKLSGGGPSLGLAIGGQVAGSLIIYGELAIAGPATPVVDGPFATPLDDVNLFGLGAGAAYYLTSHNVYLSGTLLVSQLTATSPLHADLNSRVGPGFSLMLGKEWWAAMDWGLGVAAQLWLATMRGGDFGPDRWNAAVWALNFSATYN
jgi:hypothetical protein